MHGPVLRVELSADYPGKPGVLRNVQLDLVPGRITGLVGESGSGKSTLALAIMRLLDRKAARIEGALNFRGDNLLRLSERQMRRVRGKEIALVLQTAASSLNPSLRIETQLREVWRAHASSDWRTGRDQIASLLRGMELPDDAAFLRRFPGEVSVGQAQRLLIAMAVMHQPAVLIADEPTSALDVITQAKVLKLFRSLADDKGIAILFISHDLPSVASVCEQLCILKNGSIVETGPAEQVFIAPREEYTRDLIASLPALGRPSGISQPA
jgi:ABC-type glutathione transport system ATPase component